RKDARLRDEGAFPAEHSNSLSIQHRPQRGSLAASPRFPGGGPREHTCRCPSVAPIQGPWIKVTACDAPSAANLRQTCVKLASSYRGRSVCARESPKRATPRRIRVAYYLKKKELKRGLSV
ncbi:hypothetical protein M885DRAFT_531618, partial [Pelagophyceae sp. CCMP2097]